MASFSPYIVPVTEHLGFSRGDFTVIFTIKTVLGVIIQLSLWAIIKKVGLQWVVVIGSLVIPVCFFFLGVFVAVVSADVGVGTPLINYVYDFSGSYGWMVAIYGAIGLIALLLAFLALDRKQASQTALAEIV